MKYMALIYANGEAWEALSEQEQQDVSGRYTTLAREAQERGKLVGGDELEPASTATTVRIRDGKTITTDGPFVETKEQLGGFFVFDCDDLDEAIELASRIPAAETGAVEVRPVVER
jgi:hypothetical protein